MTLQLLQSEFPYIWGKFSFLFHQCSNSKKGMNSRDKSNSTNANNNTSSGMDASKSSDATQATSNSKDGIMAAIAWLPSAHNRRTASSIRNESNNRTASTVGTPAKAGMLAKLVKQQHAARPTTGGTLLYSEMSTAAGSPDQKVGKSATGEKTATFSRNSQLEH